MKITLEAAAQKLQLAQSIVIASHVNPDGDAVGSSLAMTHILTNMGKKVHTFLVDDVPKVFAYLPGCELIKKPDVKAEKLKPDLLLVLDCSSLDRIGAVSDSVDAPILNIDHHKTNDGSMGDVYMNEERAATCEILFELVKLLNVKIDENIACCLYTGIATDTGFFRYACTTPFTMEAGAELIACGAKPHLISEAIEQKPYADVLSMARAMQTMELTGDGRIIGLYLDYELTKTLSDTEGLIDQIRVVEGTEIAVLLKCVEEKKCRVSMRSRGFDVAKIAVSFGGGGHTRAAGCTLEMSFAEAKREILRAIKDALGA